MKIKKISIHRLCENCEDTANFKLEGFCNDTVYICENCFQELKQLEVPKEPTYEWQFLYSFEKGDQRVFYITTEDRLFTDEDEVMQNYFKDGYPSDVLKFTRIEESKRLRLE